MKQKCKGTTLRNDPCMAYAILNGYCLCCFQRYESMSKKREQLDNLIEWEKENGNTERN